MCTARAPRGPLTPVVSFFNIPRARILYVLLPLFFSLLTLQPFFDIFLRTYRDKHRMSSFGINIKALYFPFRLILGQRVEGVCVLGVSSAMSKCCECQRHPSCYSISTQNWISGGVFFGRGRSIKIAFTKTNHVTVWSRLLLLKHCCNQNTTESTPVSRCCKTCQGELTWWIGVTFSQDSHMLARIVDSFLHLQQNHMIVTLVRKWIKITFSLFFSR